MTTKKSTSTFTPKGRCSACGSLLSPTLSEPLRQRFSLSRSTSHLQTRTLELTHLTAAPLSQLRFCFFLFIFSNSGLFFSLRSGRRLRSVVFHSVLPTSLHRVLLKKKK
eukprot:RCo005379